jgi:hypothetical protein
LRTHFFTGAGAVRAVDGVSWQGSGLCGTVKLTVPSPVGGDGDGFELLVPPGKPSPVLCADLARVRSAPASSLSPQED